MMKIKKILPIVGLLFLASPGVFAKKDAFSLAGHAAKPQVERQNLLKPVWQVKLKAGSPAKRYYPELSEPVLSDGVIYVGTQGRVFYAIAADSGQKIWEYQNDEPIAARAAVTASLVFFTDLSGHLHALTKNGEAVWQQDLQKEVLNAPVVAGDRIYLLKGEKEVACFSASTGTPVWSTPIPTFVKRLTIRGQADLVVDGGTVLAALADGQIYGLDAASGQVRWSKTLAPQLSTFKDIDAQIVTDGEAYYVAGYFGGVQKLARASKDAIWNLEVGAGVAPLLWQNSVVVADLQGELKSYDKKTAASLWTNELTGSVLSEPVAIQNLIYVSSFDKKGFLISPETGDIVQELSLPAGSISRPLVSGDQLVVLGNAGNLAAFRWNP